MKKRRMLNNGRAWVPVLALAAWAMVAGGCGKPEDPKGAGTAPGPVGERIQGDPIGEAPAKATAAAAGKVAVGAGASSNAPEQSSSAPAATGGTASTTAASAAAAAGAAAGSVGAAGTSPAVVASGPEVGSDGTTADRPLTVGFDKLGAFSYVLPDGPVDTNTVARTGATNQIPDTIRSLNNRFISLKGFMLPLKVEKGLVTELLVMRDQSMCCYGTVPRINEWVSVKMVGAGVKPIMDQPVTFLGKLKVGEMYENGYLVGIYALDGERMSGPLDM